MTTRTYDSICSTYTSVAQSPPAASPDDDDDDEEDEDPRKFFPLTSRLRQKDAPHLPFLQPLQLSAPERQAARIPVPSRLSLSDHILRLPNMSHDISSVSELLATGEAPKHSLPTSPLLAELSSPSAISSPPLSISPMSSSPHAVSAISPPMPVSPLSPLPVSPMSTSLPVSASPLTVSPSRSLFSLSAQARLSSSPDTSGSPDGAGREPRANRPHSDSFYRPGEELGLRTRSRSNPPLPSAVPVIGVGGLGVGGMADPDDMGLYPACSSMSAGATCSSQDRMPPVCACPNCAPGQFSEHPYGEHPSRTLFVRNINSNVEDEELRALFSPFGEIRSTYSQCKHRGFVMISYYDIRHANLAMRSLQGKVVRRRKLDIHYSIPKENPPEKDLNQGTLVVFNLDPQTKNEELLAIFGQYGQIKEIRETPNKKHHKFIEFYDVRHAEEAMRRLNKTEVRGKKIKIESSRPGGVRRVRGVAGLAGSHAGQKFSVPSSLNPDSEAFSPPMPAGLPQSPPALSPSAYVDHHHVVPYPSVPMHFGGTAVTVPEINPGYSAYPTDMSQAYPYPYYPPSSYVPAWSSPESYYQQQS